MTDPYADIDMPKPPKGYRLAKWGEVTGEWTSLFWLRESRSWVQSGSPIIPDHYEPTFPGQSIFAIPKPRIRIPLEQTT